MATSSTLWRLTLLGVALVETAKAQTGLVTTRPYTELAQASHDSEPGTRWFRLDMPVIGRPLWMSWHIGDAPSYEMMRWPTYDWQALLINRGSLIVSAFNRAQPALELDCTSSTCSPTIEKSIGLDLHLNLGGRGTLPENYVFMRRDMVFDAVHNYQRANLGFSGLLDL